MERCFYMDHWGCLFECSTLKTHVISKEKKVPFQTPKSMQDSSKLGEFRMYG